MKRSYPIFVAAIAAVLAASCASAPIAASEPEVRRLAISTGGTTGLYYKLGSMLADSLDVPGLETFVLPAGGSIANVGNLRTGAAQVAFVQNDVAAYAFAGTRMFEGLSFDELRGIAAVYPFQCQVLVPADSEVRSLRELRGKRIAVPPSSSASGIEMKQIFDALGFSEAELAEHLVEASGDEGFRLLEERVVDAVCIVAVAPTSVIADFMGSEGGRLLPIPRELVARLETEYPWFVPSLIPAGYYAGQDLDVPTLAVKAMLVARSNLPDDLVAPILEALYRKLPSLGSSDHVIAALSASEGLSGMTIPLHPAAARWFGVGP